MRLSLLKLARVKYYDSYQSMLKDRGKIMDEKKGYGFTGLIVFGVFATITYNLNKHSEPPKKVEY